MMMKGMMKMMTTPMKTLSELIEEAFTSAVGPSCAEWGSVTRDCPPWTQGSRMREPICGLAGSKGRVQKNGKIW